MEEIMEISTKPYLVRAIHEWCVDCGFTPYVAVKVDASVNVPMQFVKNDQITLNISHGAVSGLVINNDAIVFRARFGDTTREIYFPIENIIAIYARENGQGIAFEVSPEKADASPPDKDPEPPKKERVRSFSIVK